MNGGQFQCQALIDNEALVLQSERVGCHDDGGYLTVDCVLQCRLYLFETPQRAR